MQPLSEAYRMKRFANGSGGILIFLKPYRRQWQMALRLG